MGLKSKLNILGEEEEELSLRVQRIEEKSLSQQNRLSQVYIGALATRTKVFIIFHWSYHKYFFCYFNSFV